MRGIHVQGDILLSKLRLQRQVTLFIAIHISDSDLTVEGWENLATVLQLKRVMNIITVT
jgi:hypothetical protein